MSLGSHRKLFEALDTVSKNYTFLEVQFKTGGKPQNVSPVSPNIAQDLSCAQEVGWHHMSIGGITDHVTSRSSMS